MSNTKQTKSNKPATKKVKSIKKGSLFSDIKETKGVTPLQMTMTIRKIEDGRGRPPLSHDQLRFKIRAELTRQFIKIEKEAYRTFPRDNSEVELHVYRAIHSVINGK